ncbi:hypothetical protein Tco_0611196, partial [Tanacetum coccineum]
DNLLSDDASHNLTSEVISDHEPEQNESSFTFSPRSDPLHHEFDVIESLPESPIPIENSEPTQEEIDIFLVPDDLIPPGVENDDSEDEVNESPKLDHQDDPPIPRPPPEPPDIEKCFTPEAGIVIIKEFKGVSKSHDFMTGINPTISRVFLTLMLFRALVFLIFCTKLVWICQILQEISQKRTRERMSDQEAKEIKAEAREIMPQPSTVNCS